MDPCEPPLRRPSGRRRWTSFVAPPAADGKPVRVLQEKGNAEHRLRVEHDRETLLIHLSDEDGSGWTTLVVDRASRRWAVAQGVRQIDVAANAYDALYLPATDDESEPPPRSGPSELDVLRVRRWCEALPASVEGPARHIELETTPRDITIVVRRPTPGSPEAPRTQWARIPAARLRWSPEDRLWTLLRADRQGRFHPYEIYPTSASVEDLLEEMAGGVEVWAWE